MLAADVTAAWPLPGFDNSAMDGYAVDRRRRRVGQRRDTRSRCRSTPRSRPATRRPHAHARATAIKIMTGALLPAGADAVIPVEWTDGGSDTVAITAGAPRQGNAIRRAGDDAQPGDLLLPAGTRLGAGPDRRARRGRSRRGPGAAPPASHRHLDRQRARRARLAAGSRPDLGLQQLHARRRRPAGRLRRRSGTPSCRDEPDAVLAAIELAAATADLLITSGGVSMGGEHDVVKAALTMLGSVTFRKVAMQPGMPQGFGLLGARPTTPIFTLPGNPVSALVSFRALRRAGRPCPARPSG